MLTVNVTIRARQAEYPAYKCKGKAPFAGSPLAVTAATLWDEDKDEWVSRPGYEITHTPTGYRLGGDIKTWKTEAEAIAAMQRCDPTYPAWPLAKGHPDDPATIACRVMFKAATGD